MLRPLALAVVLMLGGAAGTVAHELPVPDALGEWSGLELRLEVAVGSAPVSCELILAHWYERRFGPVVGGEEIVIPLLARESTGEVGLLNDASAIMRLERIACGMDGVTRRDWQMLPIERLRTAPDSIRLQCDTRLSTRSPCRYPD